MQASPNHLTEFLAAWGAILSTLGMGWTLYRDLLDHAKLQLSAGVRRIASGDDGKYYSVAPKAPVQPISEKLFVVMTVVNVGRRPVMWQGWGGKYRDGKPGFQIVGQGLPKMLQEGESHDEIAELEGDVNPISENVRKLYVWDAAGRKWSLSRKQLKKLKREAREAKVLEKPA